MDNGIVVFINENAEKFGFPNPYPDGFDGTHSLVAVTPFWTDSDLATSETAEVFYQVCDLAMFCKEEMSESVTWYC